LTSEDSAQVCCAQDHDVVQALPPDRADEPFGAAILPRRPRRSWSIPNSHGRKTPRYAIAI
jgi:hypothetical protein